MIELRPYQHEAVSKIRTAYAGGARAPLYVAPTGSGKTVTFAHIASGALAKGTRTYVLVHRQELVRQTVATFEHFNIPCGLIVAGRASTNAQIAVASVQTLARRLGRVIPPQFLVIDEAHHARAHTWRAILNAYPDARLLGVTATPWRMNGAGLGVAAGGCFDRLVLGPSAAWLIANGYLARPRYYAPPIIADLDAMPSRGGDYQVGVLEARMDRPTVTGDAVEHYRRICPGVPAVAFCASRAHAGHVAEAFNAAGVSAASIDGSLDNDARADRVAALADGRILVLTSCDLISEGFDLPAVTAAILLRPTQSLAMCLQQIGRALRPVEGKKCAYILDHVGNIYRHGLAEDERDWSLEGRPKRDKKSPQTSGATFRRCPECFVLYPPHRPTCPECGADAPIQERTPEQIAGELKAVEQAEMAIARRLSRIERGRAQSIEQLIKLGEERGYRNPWVWAHHVYGGRQRRKVNAAATA